MKVLVLVVNGLNCHWLGPYGNEWVSTHAFDRLASESVVFDHHFASEPGPRDGWADCERLAEEFLDNLLIDDRKEREPRPASWSRVIVPSIQDTQTPGDALRQALSEALQDPGEFILVESDRLVPPWDLEFETYQQYAESSGGVVEERDPENEPPTDNPPPGPFDHNNLALWHQVRNSFAAAVTSFDTELASLLELWKTAGLHQSATLVVTSRHGWPLGEHGWSGVPGSRPHEELVHLPLVIRLPEAEQAGRRIGRFTQSRDLAAYIREKMVGTPNPGILTRSIRGESFPDNQLCKVGTSIRSAEWCYLSGRDGQVPRLYSKPDDLWEVNDLAPRFTDLCDQFEALLHRPGGSTVPHGTQPSIDSDDLTGDPGSGRVE